MFVMDGQRITFGGLALVDPAMPALLTPGAAIRAIGTPASRTLAELVWGWSAESNSPFMPLCRVVAGDKDWYVDMAGQATESIHLQ